jgi:hypothetical protein
MNYNFFYNLHIPKTGGSFFRDAILADLEFNLKLKGIQTAPDHMYHWCWFKPYITNNTYIYTSLRDPVERLISQFSWQAKAAILFSKTPYSYEDVNKLNFYKWLEAGDGLYKNVQSKHLVYYNQDHSIYVHEKNSRWEVDDVPKRDHFTFSNDFKNFIINKDELLKHVKRLNFVINAKDLNDTQKQKQVLKHLYLELGLCWVEKDGDLKTSVQPNELSAVLYKAFTDKEKQKLYEYQELDSELFFSDVYTVY